MKETKVNASYLQKETITQIKKSLDTEGFVRLGMFLEESLLSKMSKESKTFQKKSVPNKYSYAVLPKNEHAFTSVESFLSSLTKKKGLSVSADILSFSKGDYTLLHDLESYKKYKGVGFLFFTEEWNSDVGGHLVIREIDGNHNLVTPLDNSFVYISDLKKLSFFIQYLNASIGSGKFFVIRFLVS